jgi:hypothetical protein
MRVQLPVNKVRYPPSALVAILEENKMALDDIIKKVSDHIDSIPMLGGEAEDLLRECLIALEASKESSEALEEENKLLSLRISKLISVGE